MFLKTTIRIFDYIAQGSSAFLLGVVAINIAARQIHQLSSGSINLMIPGTIELSKYALLIIIFAALPRAVTSKMVSVNLLSDQFSKGIKNSLDRLWLIVMALFLSILTILFSQKTYLTFSRGDASQDLQMPLFYFYALITLACFFATLSCLFKSFKRKDSES